MAVALGVLLIGHGAFPAVWFASNGQSSIEVTYVLLGCWGLAMGMQTAVRTLHVDGVFTTAATATIILLLGDLAGWSATMEEGGGWRAWSFSLIIAATT